MRPKFLKRQSAREVTFDIIVFSVLLLLVAVATAGDAKDKANAAVAVARAALEIADEQPDLPKSSKSSGQNPISSVPKESGVPDLKDSGDTGGNMDAQGIQSAKVFAANPLDASVTIRFDVKNVSYHGSGTIIDSGPDGSIVMTAAHLSRDTKDPKVSVKFHNREYPARFIREDTENDLATYSVPFAALPVQLADRLPTNGQVLVSIGERTLKQVSVIKVDKDHEPHVIITTGRETMGRSGGGLFDGRYLVGVVNSVADHEPQSIYIELDTIKRFLRKPTNQKGELIASANVAIGSINRRLVTIYTAEKTNGKGWCEPCRRLKESWGNGNSDVEIVWSEDDAPALPNGIETTYPAIRFNDSRGRTLFPSSADGRRYVAPNSLEALVKTIDFAR